MTGTCADCGAKTEIVNRRIGFFGLTETYSRFCRPCLPAHAHEWDMTEAQALALYDSYVDAVRRGREEHKARQQARRKAG